MLQWGSARVHVVHVHVFDVVNVHVVESLDVDVHVHSAHVVAHVEVRGLEVVGVEAVHFHLVVDGRYALDEFGYFVVGLQIPADEAERAELRAELEVSEVERFGFVVVDEVFGVDGDALVVLEVGLVGVELVVGVDEQAVGVVGVVELVEEYARYAFVLDAC